MKIRHIFVGQEADENNCRIFVGRPTKIFPGPRKYATFSSVTRPMKITVVFSSADENIPTHENLCVSCSGSPSSRQKQSMFPLWRARPLGDAMSEEGSPAVVRP
jgi:hypothetical protein